jgi:aromatic-L-amino-acid decarboxylase
MADTFDAAGHDRRPPLEIDPEEFRRLGYRAVDLVTDYLAGIRGRSVFRPMTVDERRALLEQPMPEDGLAPDAALRRFQESVLPHSMGNGHPRFFGWVNAPPAPVAVLGELLAAAMNPSCAGGDHAAIYLERCAVRWLAELLEYPIEGGMGLIVSGGSMASLTCLAAARHHAVAALGGDVRSAGLPGQAGLVLYMSEEGHSCLRKSAELLGLGAAAVRTVPVDAAWRLDVGALREAIAADRAAGRRPFCVSASAGTVNTGAIDPLDAIAGVCAEERLWFHVDGAYGGPGVLDPSAASRYAGMARADSLAIDPHKWLSVPVECGCALVRDGRLLRETFSLVPPYLQTEEGKGFGGLPWYSEYGFQQTRGFRALKIWMALRYHGLSGYRSSIERDIRLAELLASALRSSGEFEVFEPQSLSIVCFRYTPPKLQKDAEAVDRLNKALLEKVQLGGQAFLSSTVLDGRFWLRACIINPRTREEDLEELVQSLVSSGRSATGMDTVVQP